MPSLVFTFEKEAYFGSNLRLFAMQYEHNVNIQIKLCDYSKKRVNFPGKHFPLRADEPSLASQAAQQDLRQEGEEQVQVPLLERVLA